MTTLDTHLLMRLRDYFALPHADAPIREMHWSDVGLGGIAENDSLILPIGKLVAFLEGFSAARPMPRFVWVLHSLSLLGYASEAYEIPIDRFFARLQHEFKDADRPLRNAGFLFGEVCAEWLPTDGDLPPGTQPHRWLGEGQFLMPLLQSSGESPSKPLEMPIREFQQKIARALDAMPHAELRHRLRHGIAPVAAEPLTQAIGRKPPSLGERLRAMMAERPRMRGAMPFVSSLISALTIPPRKRAVSRLPLGGYSDVTTRGNPDQLLPSQFALDPDEFVRRFSSGELLYFRREEPQVRRREELVLVVDQGVRTWGAVRLRLIAAVLALTEFGERDRMRIHLRVTSQPDGILAMTDASDAALIDALEAADLSPMPLEVLSNELRRDDAPDRDIVVLTHPRTLTDPLLYPLAGMQTEGTRMFAVTVDEDGEGGLHRWNGGTPETLSRFRVTSEPVAAPMSRTQESLFAWKGDIEPVGFAVRFGITTKVKHLCFDPSGTLLLAVAMNSMLHLYDLGTDAEPEVLPRPMFQGSWMKEIAGVFSWGRKFVLCGTCGENEVVAVYDLETRKVTAHDFGPTKGYANESQKLGWKFSQLIGCVLRDRDIEGRSGSLLLLREGSFLTREAKANTTLEIDAWESIASLNEFGSVGLVGTGSFPKGYVLPQGRRQSGGFWEVESPHGRIVAQAAGVPFFLTIQLDGKPLTYPEDQIVGVSVVGSLAAVRWKTTIRGGPNHAEMMSLGGIKSAEMMSLYRIPETPGGEATFLQMLSADAGDPAIDSDGSQLAIPWNDDKLALVNVRDSLPPKLLARGHTHSDVRVTILHGEMLIGIGLTEHRFGWETGVLTHEVRQRHSVGNRHDDLTARTFPEAVAYDRSRFHRSTDRAPWIVRDRLGEVLILSKDGRRVLVMIFVRRQEYAVRLADGSGFGTPRLLIQPASPTAPVRAAELFREAGMPG